MEHKTVPAYLKQVDEQGIVECIFAVFGNIDEGKDIIHPGAFKKTLMERGNKVRVLDQHNTDSINRVLGKPLDIREISGNDLPMELKAEYPNATGGVWARTQFFLDTPEGKGAFIRLKEKGIDEWSFGYDAVDVDYTPVTIDSEKYQVRNLRQVKLFEISPVLWGMNPATSTLDAKETETETEDQPEYKAVTPYQNLDLADRRRAWDDDAAEARVREWAGGEDDMDWQKYRQAFLWYDAENPETFGAYKLGYADIVDGDLVAVPRGVFTAAASLQGSRGQAPDIPAADADRVKRNIERYYAKMRAEFEDDTLIAPWNKAAGGAPSTSSGDGAKGDCGCEDDTLTGENTVGVTFNVPDGFAPDEFEKAVTAALRSAGLTIKEEKGNLTRLLNDRIEALVTDDRSRSDIVAAMGQTAGITAGTVNQILDGDIDCPPERRRRGFAEALDISLSRINSAMEEDGCAMGEESAGDDPAESKVGGLLIESEEDKALLARFFGYLKRDIEQGTYDLVESKEAKGMGASRLGDVLQGNIHYIFTCLVDKWYIHGYMNRDERLLLSSLIGDALEVLEVGMPEDLAGRDVSHGPLMADYGYAYYGLTPEIEEKAGRMLSARNAQKIQAALAQLHEILMAAGMLPEPDEASAHHDEDDDDEEKGGNVPGRKQEAEDGADDLLHLIELEAQEMSMMNLF